MTLLPYVQIYITEYMITLPLNKYHLISTIIITINQSYYIKHILQGYYIKHVLHIYLTIIMILRIWL